MATYTDPDLRQRRQQLEALRGQFGHAGTTPGGGLPPLPAAGENVFHITAPIHDYMQQQAREQAQQQQGPSTAGGGGGTTLAGGSYGTNTGGATGNPQMKGATALTSGSLPAPNVPAGSRDADLMADPAYVALLAALEYDRNLAQTNTTFQKNQAALAFTQQQAELARRAEEERAALEATLRGRGVRGKSSQREALAARSREEEAERAQQLSLSYEEQLALIDQALQQLLADISRRETLGAGEAAERLQRRRDEALARQQQAAINEQMLQAQQQASQATQDMLNRLTQQQQQIGGPLVHPSTGRPIYSGPYGEPGWHPSDPNMPPNAVVWTMPDGRQAAYVPGSAPDPGNRIALGWLN